METWQMLVRAEIPLQNLYFLIVFIVCPCRFAQLSAGLLFLQTSPLQI